MNMKTFFPQVHSQTNNALFISLLYFHLHLRCISPSLYLTNTFFPYGPQTYIQESHYKVVSLSFHLFFHFDTFGHCNTSVRRLHTAPNLPIFSSGSKYAHFFSKSVMSYEICTFSLIVSLFGMRRDFIVHFS